jgi:hypothetical protein
MAPREKLERELKQAEEALWQLAEKYRALIDPSF